MLTAMHAVEKVTKEAGQISILTCDQQLHRVVVNIVWADPEQWSQFFPSPRGMHILMSFIDCVGKLKGGSAVSMVIGKAFSGVEKKPLGGGEGGFFMSLCAL